MRESVSVKSHKLFVRLRHGISAQPRIMLVMILCACALIFSSGCKKPVIDRTPLGEQPQIMASDARAQERFDAALDLLDAGKWAESREAFRRIVNLGFTDAFRARVGGAGHYSFWDYQAGAWNRDDGIRIDHLLLTPQCADLLRDVGIDKEIRGFDKPSDHVPVWAEIDI